MKYNWILFFVSFLSGFTQLFARADEPPLRVEISFLSLGDDVNDLALFQPPKQLASVFMGEESFSKSIPYLGPPLIRLFERGTIIDTELGILPEPQLQAPASVSWNGQRILGLVWNGRITGRENEPDSLLLFPDVFLPEKAGQLQIFNFCPNLVLLDIEGERRTLKSGRVLALDKRPENGQSYRVRAAWKREDAVELKFDGYIYTGWKRSAFLFIYPEGEKLQNLRIHRVLTNDRIFERPESQTAE